MGNGTEQLINDLAKKATLCGSQPNMPMSPVWHLGKMAAFGNKSSYKLIQDALDHLSCKAKSKAQFEDSEKEFLIEMYEAFWWGGKFKGLPEAAKLANHYVNGGGRPTEVDSYVYQNSPIVQKTQLAIKSYIEDIAGSSTFPLNISSKDLGFLNSKYAMPLRNMNFRTEGKLKPGGVLEAAQSDHRLHKTDAHFYLSSVTKRAGERFSTQWSVRSVYDFEPYEKHDYYTLLPLGDFEVRIDDGLSHYMTVLGIANAFTHTSKWSEQW
jgi:hypothetical protein